MSSRQVRLQHLFKPLARRSLRVGCLLVVWMVIFVAYQNFSGCGGSGVHFANSQSSSGNGEPFDNKLVPGTYYRWTPGFTCKGKPTLIGKIKVATTTLEVEILNSETCKLEPRTVAAHELIGASALTDSTSIIGFENSVYVRQHSDFDLQAPPPVSIEAWCQNENVRVVISNNARGEILDAELMEMVRVGPRATWSASRRMGVVQRSLDARKLAYKNAALSLDIDRVVKSSTELWSATLSLPNPNGGTQNAQSLTCRLGSRLDTANNFYPARQMSLFGPVLPSGMSLRRSTIGSYFDASGIMRVAASDQPRFSHDPESGVPLGLLLERDAVNLLPSSSGLDSWTLSGLSVEPNSPRTTAPDGSNSAEYFTVGTAVSRHQVLQRHTLTPGSPYSFTVYAKVPTTNAQRLLRLQIIDQATYQNEIWATFDLLAAVVDVTTMSGDGAGASASVERLRNGWMRLRVSGIPSATSANMEVFIQAMDASGSTGVYGDPLQSGFFLWGAQLEAGLAASSYIATGPSPAARSMDLLSMDTSSLLGVNPSRASLMLVSQASIPVLSATPEIKQLMSLQGLGPERLSVELDPVASVMRGLFPTQTPSALTLPLSIFPQSLAPIKTLVGFEENAVGMGGAGVARSGSAAVDSYFAPTHIQIGGSTNQEKWIGHFQDLFYWPYLLEPETRALLSR